jgi:hypothetical protein
MDSPRQASWLVMEGRGEDPLQEVSILVLDVFTKQPSNAPFERILLHRNSRSGKYTQVEMSST